ncbi:hypothetical protein B0T22DRAFT_201114 [Podospora appendiculata]|uniref:Pentatricopeptide repeat-containing protein n=1 Tax=Podospora appendiculata TaxID=314037 RepID=A0AAE0X4A4_9PEZI|nr:hypothetical protein B0T22DRAFT_201114 [Podospora appendiculata]
MRAAFVCRSCLARIQHRQQALRPALPLALPVTLPLRSLRNHSTAQTVAVPDPAHDTWSPKQQLEPSAAEKGQAEGTPQLSRNSRQPGPRKTPPVRKRNIIKTEDGRDVRMRRVYVAPDSATWFTAMKENVSESKGEESGRAPADQTREIVDPKYLEPKPDFAFWYQKHEWLESQDGRRRLLAQRTPRKEWKQARQSFQVWGVKFVDAWSRLRRKRRVPNYQPENSGFKQLKRLLNRGDVEAMRERWQTVYSKEKRARAWPHVMVCALGWVPERAHEVLHAIYEEDVAPYYAVEDTMRFCAERASMLSDDQRPEYGKALSLVLLHVLRNSPKGLLRFRQNTIFQSIRHADPETVAEIHSKLRNLGHPLRVFTKLQIARFSADSIPHKSVALGIAQELVADGVLNMNGPLGAALATTLLKFPREDQSAREDEDREGQFGPADVYDALVACGMRPNLINYSAMIRNFCLSEELDAARLVFDLMEKQQIAPDAQLFSILSHGSKLRLDLNSLRHVLTNMEKAGIRDAVVWNDFLQSIYLTALQEMKLKRIKPPRVVTAFPFMAKAYSMYFKTGPLQELLPSNLQTHLQDADSMCGNESYHAEWIRTVTPLLNGVPAVPPEELLTPGSDTLSIMLLGYVKGFSKVYNIIAFYSHFRNLIRAGNPVAVKLVQDNGSMIHDIIIKSLLEHYGMLRVSLDVVSDMLKDGAAAAEAEAAGREDTVPRHPMPSVYTWSILLNGFMYNKQHKQGEAILKMMCQNGVEPNQVTWNTLAAGYARDQGARKVASALQRMEMAGFKANGHTMRAFSYLNNQAAALRDMEAMVEKRKQALQQRQLALKNMQGAVGTIMEAVDSTPDQPRLDSRDWTLALEDE